MSVASLNRTFAALAHPARRAMLARLSEGEASVQELARPFKMSAPAISRHLKVLEKSGLITRSRDAQWRPCRLDPRPMQEAVDWIEHTRRELEGRFDRLDLYLAELQRAPAPQDPQAPQAPHRHHKNEDP